MRRQTNENDWPYLSEPPRFDSPGLFDAWIVGLDLPSSLGASGVSAFAWQLQTAGITGIIRAEDSRPSDGDGSDEARACIAAAYRVVEALAPDSGIDIHCRLKFVVDSINGGVNKWRRNGWRKSDGTPVKHQEIWKRFLKARDGDKQNPRNIVAVATHCPIKDARHRETFDKLMSQARGVAELHRRDLANKPGGFGTISQ